ncbi:phage terminase small subunit, partial [Bacillus cereus]
QNDNAVTHGFFRKHFPEDVADLAAEIMEKNPIDMLWENITIQYTAIIRAQRLMFVKDQEDTSREVKKETDMGTEYEIQFAWDKHANFLNAQSRAMSTLSSLIRDFDKLANIDDERRAKLNLMNAQIDKIRNELKDENPAEDKIGQYLDKLEGAFKR